MLRTLRCRIHCYWPALVLALMALLAYTYSIPRGELANADSHIALTRAIVEQHTLRIDAYASGLVDRSFYRGHYYTDKDPGLSLLAVPIYAALRLLLPRAFFAPDLFFSVRYMVTVFVLSVPAALFVGLLYLFLARLIGRPRAALLACGYGFGTMAWGLSALLFSHMIAAMATFGAFMLLYPALCSTGPSPFALRPSPSALRPAWRWGAAGGLCGLAVLCEYPSALVAAGVAVFAAYVAGCRGLRRAVAPMALFAVVGALALAPLAAYNVAVYGSPFSQGYAHLHGAREFVDGMSHGVEGVGLPSLSALWGITFSPYRGLFVLSPFLLLALPGLGRMWRRRAQRPIALLCAYAVCAMLLFNSAYYFWDGGTSLGPRHFSPALPFLLVPIARALRDARWYRIGRALIALSIGIVALCCVTVIVFIPGVPDPILSLALPHLLHGPTLNNWGLLFGLRGPGSLLPLAVGEAVLAFVLWRSLHPARQKRDSAEAKPGWRNILLPQLSR